MSLEVSMMVYVGRFLSLSIVGTSEDVELLLNLPFCFIASGVMCGWD